MDQCSAPAVGKDRVKRPRLLLADDHNILLEGVRKLLESEYELVGSAADGGTLIADVARLQPDIIVLDISMPVLNGIECARQVGQSSPNTKIVFLTQQSDKAYVQEAFRVGASAYLLKQSAAGELLAALRQVFQGGSYISRSLVEAGTSVAANGSFREAALTPRQLEVLKLVAQAKTANEIAATLGISIKTVEFHEMAIMEELGVRTTAELTRYAVSRGMVDDSRSD